MRHLRKVPRTWRPREVQQDPAGAVPGEEGVQMKRSWTVSVGNKRFTMILMEDCDPVEVVKSIWPEGRIEQ